MGTMNYVIAPTTTSRCDEFPNFAQRRADCLLKTASVQTFFNSNSKVFSALSAPKLRFCLPFCNKSTLSGLLVTDRSAGKLDRPVEQILRPNFRGKVVVKSVISCNLERLESKIF